MVTSNESFEYVYTTIPIDYVCVYHAILEAMSSYGEDMLKDCKAKCTNRNENIIDCYNMFNSAVSARRIGKTKLAKTIISYIKGTLKQLTGIDCDNTSFTFTLGINQDIKVVIIVENGDITIKTTDSDLFYSVTYNGNNYLLYVPNYINPYTHKRFVQLIKHEDYYLTYTENNSNYDLVQVIPNEGDIEYINSKLEELGFSILYPGDFNMEQQIIIVHNGDFHSPQGITYTFNDIITNYLPNIREIDILNV